MNSLPLLQSNPSMGNGSRLRISCRVSNPLQGSLGWLERVVFFYLFAIKGDFVKKPGVQMIAKVLGIPMEDLLK